MKHFFGLPSNAIDRNTYYQNLWKTQVLLNKVSNISMETSDTFTQMELDLCFQALEDMNKERENDNSN